MAEGFYRSGEARPSDAGISEPSGTDSAYTADEEMPGPSRRHAGTHVAETAPEAAAAPARSVLKRPLLLLMAVVLLGVVAMAGWRYYAYFVAHEWTDDAFIEGRIIQISPKVAGHVLRVDVMDNQEVQQGDLLLEIDHRWSWHAVGSSKRGRKSTLPWPTPHRCGPRWPRLKLKSHAPMLT